MEAGLVAAAVAAALEAAAGAATGAGAVTAVAAAAAATHPRRTPRQRRPLPPLRLWAMARAAPRHTVSIGEPLSGSTADHVLRRTSAHAVKIQRW